jgi:hypothetical protein
MELFKVIDLNIDIIMMEKLSKADGDHNVTLSQISHFLFGFPILDHQS